MKEALCIQGVYLAGSVHGKWKSQVIASCNHIKFLDPQSHGLSDIPSYTTWNLHFIRQCDLVFAFLDNEREHVEGTLFEIGYAKGAGKTVILVDERSSLSIEHQKHLAQIAQGVDVHFDSLDMGIKLLQSFDLPCTSDK